MEETLELNDPPERLDEVTPCAVMTGDIYELLVTFSACSQVRQSNTAKVGLDTCAGCNLIRRNQLPEGAVIRRTESASRVRSAQGQHLDMIG